MGGRAFGEQKISDQCSLYVADGDFKGIFAHSSGPYLTGRCTQGDVTSCSCQLNTCWRVLFMCDVRCVLYVLVVSLSLLHCQT